MSKFFLFLWEYRQSLVFVLLLLISLFALSLPGKQRFTLARKINRAVIAPFQQVVSQTDYLLRMKKENETLRKNNFTLALELYRLEEAKRNNQKLEQLLEFANRAEIHFIACRIISGGLGEKANIFIIDKGSKHGLTENLPVLVPEGLVGKTIEIDQSRSLVQLYTHQDFRVSAKPLHKDERAIAGSAAEGELYLFNIAQRTQISPGDQIVSSGMGGIFPKGIPIGTVIGLEQEEELGITLQARLEPAVKLDQISEVFVLADSAFVSPGSGLLFEATDSLVNLWYKP